MGKSKTYHIRITAVLENNNSILKINCMGFSFPFYWIMESEIDSIK